MERQMFDNVKYEKRKAMTMFSTRKHQHAPTTLKRLRRREGFYQLIKFLVLLVVIYWSIKKIPSVTELSFKLLHELEAYLHNPLVVFVIVNFIMLALFVLSKQNNVENESAHNVYDENALYNNTLHKAVSPETEKQPEFPSLDENEKPGEKGMKIVLDNEQCEAVEVEITEAVKKIRRFERSKSETLKREINVRPKKELRRWESRSSLYVVRNAGGERRILRPTVNNVDHLSNEDFKLAIDDFINKHRVKY